MGIRRIVAGNGILNGLMIWQVLSLFYSIDLFLSWLMKSFWWDLGFWPFLLAFLLWFVLSSTFCRISKGKALCGSHKLVHLVPLHQMHHKVCSPLISHGYHLDHKGSLLCHPPLHIDHRWTLHPCSSGHIFPSNILPCQQICSNSIFHLCSHNNRNHHISCLTIMGNSFPHQGCLNLHPINSKLQGRRALQLRNLPPLHWYSLTLSRPGIRVK